MDRVRDRDRGRVMSITLRGLAMTAPSYGGPEPF